MALGWFAGGLLVRFGHFGRLWGSLRTALTIFSGCWWLGDGLGVGLGGDAGLGGDGFVYGIREGYCRGD